MNNKSVTYRPEQKLKELIDDNSSLLMLMSRFGISLGFGDKTVKEICEELKIDINTFLILANHISGNVYNTSGLSIPELIQYLKNAHDYFLDFNLPSIRRKLIEAIDCSEKSDLGMLIIKYYDEYVLEVRHHMDYEDKTVFRYVDDLLNGKRDEKYSIATFGEKHNRIALKLSELKNIIVRYYPGKSDNLLNSVLFDIINCEQDLNSHCEIEDMIFIPAVEELEKSISPQNSEQEEKEKKSSCSDDHFDLLSEREKDILTCVAKGMTNKEIAEHLFLSVHTVTKHRYNISSKIQIHTPAGLTIYAIVHNLIDIKDIQQNL